MEQFGDVIADERGAHQNVGLPVDHEAGMPS